ncbi:MAG: hypothetical protein OI74_01535 [Gammaproteobacteria bacterium (ex Lamellibrachia satsuma)]|nr:MAG: hypothetical protein OI74_01535 [Gammaproteobacteria bacterium (ex Lamellibrachia satsuma)]RRS36235.1 MAG: hypothetical protein NV67_08090 [Gammaproteobacteria bacterium (ex Lamellibrachia satsuma)]
MRSFSPDRRKFLKLSMAAAGSSLILGVSWSCTQDKPSNTDNQSDNFSPNAWLRLDPDGSITVIVAESEMGQGPYTLMPMMVAEELEVEWDRIKVEHASLDPVYGYQMTGGSGSIRKGWSTLREAGAVAKALLLGAGALALSVPVTECTARLGKVVHIPSGREVAYNELTDIAAKLPIPGTAQLKEPNEFTIIGQPVPRLDVPEKINGKARFGIDTKLPGMLYATITHCPVFGGKPKSIDASEAKSIKGVKDVFPIDEGVVVVASDTWTAFKAKEVLSIDWECGNKTRISSESIINQLKARPIEEAQTALEEGDVETVLSGSNAAVTAEYIQPFQAHVPLEPMNCTAHFKSDGRLEVWAPTQSPSSAYDTAKAIVQSKIERGLKKVQKKLLGIHDDSINVHTTLLGGGFGRRLKQDYVSEVVQVAQRYEQPVQLVWTREEDVQHDHYHPLTLHKMRGAIDENGMPIAWEHIIHGLKVNASGAATLLYDIPNTRVLVQDIGAIVPWGPWRSVAPHYNIFAVEHFFDELARAGNNDPLELRLKLLRDHPRLSKVLEIAADKAKWEARPNGAISYGAAVLSEWGSNVAQIVELAETDNKYFQVKKVTCVIDCGIVINPDIVKQQMEGSIIFGLSAATKSKITINNGRVDQSNYHNYPILGIHETPEIEVIIVNNEEEPGGIGEPGVPPLAPALANAVLSATGKPIRELPI